MRPQTPHSPAIFFQVPQQVTRLIHISVISCSILPLNGQVVARDIQGSSRIMRTEAHKHNSNGQDHLEAVQLALKRSEQVDHDDSEYVKRPLKRMTSIDFGGEVHAERRPGLSERPEQVHSSQCVPPNGSAGAAMGIGMVLVVRIP